MGCASRKQKDDEAVLTLKAALLIQQWHRRNLARIEMRRRSTWTIFQSLEYSSEQDQIELYNFFNALLAYIPATGMPDGSISGTSPDEGQLNLDDEGVVDEIEKTYTGPPIGLPLGRKDIDTVIEVFRKKKNNLLPVKYVALILRESAKRLKKLPNFNSASTALSNRVTIVGDLHGKLDDLLVVFHKNGLPSTENPYVFNGDFVDRGKKSLECLLLLLTCFLVHQNCMFLNRGNHEDTSMNARYGFLKEVDSKYPRFSDQLIKLIEEVYRWLPLGTIVNSRVLVVHGGISDNTDMDMLKSLDRGRFVSILRPPEQMDRGDADRDEWRQIFDIMWSDPTNSYGCEPNIMRGAGTWFGPDITEEFLARYNFKYLIRSHECKPEGYEFTHNDQLITIFSASNYYAIGSNKGAYMRLDPYLKPQFIQYISAASKTMNLTFREKVDMVQNSAIRELGARLRAKRNELEEEFRAADPKKTGIITINKWCDCLDRATGLQLPWRLIRDQLAPADDTILPSEVNYLATLELLDTDIIKDEHENAMTVADALYTNKSSLEAIFHIIDKDHSGTISLDEFGEACDLLVKFLPGTNSREQLLDICRMMDLNNDGLVDLNEFLEAFRLCEPKRARYTVQQPQPNPGTPEQRKRSSGPVANVVERLTSTKIVEHDTEIDPSDHAPKKTPAKPPAAAPKGRASAHR